MADFEFEREKMVQKQLAERGIKDQAVLNAFLKIPRHKFIPEDGKDSAYEDFPLPIGLGQTISQPYIVALMTQYLQLKPGEKVLEIGTGSGYQAAILRELGAEVYTVERLKPLYQQAKEVLSKLGYDIQMKLGDGTEGWPEFSPFDKVIITAAVYKVPKPVSEQVSLGGIIVLPRGGLVSQTLTVLKKTSRGFSEEQICGCVFVPLVGKYGFEN